MSPSTKPEPEQVHVESVADWHAWLAAHHERPTGIWLVQWKSHTGKPRMTYDELVEEALCWGWVDSKSGRVDEDRDKLWLSPRRKGSAWSRPNKQRIERLEAAGRLQPAGRALVERAQADGTWTILDEVEDLIVPPDLAAAFAARPGSREAWEAFPRSARRAILEWIVLAKRPETRERRVSETAEKAARGERANQWSPKA